jgi:hypothetical protein
MYGYYMYSKKGVSHKNMDVTLELKETLPIKVCHGSAVSIMTGCGLDSRGSTSGRGIGMMLSSTMSRTVRGRFHGGKVAGR